MKVIIKSKIYHNQNSTVVALENVELSIQNSGLYVISGDSGVGKTTLLNIMAHEDTDFDGQVDQEGSVSYVKQEIEMLETLRVIQHLYLSSKDKNAVHDVMKGLQIEHLKNKKIKHLSLGQKRRVQFACALLIPCDYLICDEPTASLDSENAHIIMKELKQRSKTQCIILVSHDEKFFDEYADAIYHLENTGITEVMKAKESHPLNTSIDSSIHKHQHLFIVSLQLLYSRFFEHAFRCIVCILLVLTMIGGTMFFSHIHSTQRQKDAWFYEENVIMSQPKLFNEMGYVTYDTYTQNDLNRVKERSPSIIGYEWGWDIDLYLTFAEQEEQEKGYTYRPFLMETLGKIYVKEDKENGYEGWEYIAPMLSGVGLDKELYSKEFYNNHRLRIFQMFDIEVLPLIAGNYPKLEQEVIIDTIAADYYVKKMELQKMEDLIGKEISFYTYPNAYEIDMIVERTMYPVKISGITSLNSQRSPRMYTLNGAYDRFLADSYMFQSDLPEHMFLNLLLDEPNNSVISTVNELLENDRNKFVWSKEYNAFKVYPEHEFAIYQSPITIYTYSFGAYLVILLIVVVSEWLLQKRNAKEQGILKRFGYDMQKVKRIELLFYYLTAFLVAFPIIETYASRLNDAFFQIHPSLLALMCIVCFFIHAEILVLLSKRERRK